MCIWVHPTDESQSLIVCADKTALRLLTYNLDGTLHQNVSLSHRPGNIDIRYGFPMWMGSQTTRVDLVGYNERSGTSPDLCFYYVDRTTRNLVPYGSIPTTSWGAELYGFCMYHSPASGQFYAMGCSKRSKIRQYEISDNNGTITGTLIREIQNGQTSNLTEGMVCDDELQYWYAANESEGIYIYDAEPNTGTTPVHHLPIAAGGLQADVEGVAIYYAANGAGYVIASSQGADYFTVFERTGWASVGNFSIVGVGDTDGIDVLNVSLGSTFANGLFASHDGTGSPYAVVLTEWEDIADEFTPGLVIDSGYYDPRAARELEASAYTCSVAAGCTIQMTLDAGVANANRNYIILGGTSGTSPGTLLPGGLATLPVNWDAMSGILFNAVNTPMFTSFIGQLDASGRGAATLDTLGPLPPALSGLTVQFAYTLFHPFDFVSNPIPIALLP